MALSIKDFRIEVNVDSEIDYNWGTCITTKTDEEENIEYIFHCRIKVPGTTNISDVESYLTSQVNTILGI